MNDPPRIPMVFHPALVPSTEPVLLVLLPGFDMNAEDFARHGFLDMARRHAPEADIIVAKPDLDLYLEGTVGADIASLLRSAGRSRRRVWLAAISLGCFGALSAVEHSVAIEGIILLAPFLGTAGLIAELGRAGGLALWDPGEVAEDDHERQLLARLRSGVCRPEDWPVLYLGYGRSDRFAAASRLLAAILPPSRIFEIEGAHDWPSWERLWERILAAHPFARGASRPAWAKLDF